MKKSYAVIILTAVFLLLSGYPCIIRLLFGIPCPGCGMTRAYRALFMLDFRKAFFMHPLFPLPPLFPVIYRLLKNDRVQNIFILIAIFLFIGVYIYRMAVYFPDTEPMSFNKSNILISYISERYGG